VHSLKIKKGKSRRRTKMSKMQTLKGKAQKRYLFFKQILALARKATGEIDDASPRAWAQVSLVKALIGIKDLKQARRTAGEIESPYWQVEAWLCIANSSHKIQDFERVREAMSMSIIDEEKQNETKKTIAKVLIKIGYLRQARELAGEISTSYHRTEIQANLVEALVVAGKFEEACEVKEEIDDGIRRNQARISIIQALAKAGEIEQARKMVDEVDAHWRIEALTKAGDFKQAREEAAKINDDIQRNLALETIAKALSRVGEIEQAREVISEISNSSGDSRGRTLLDIVKILVEIKSFKQASEVAAGIDRGYYQTEAHFTIVKALVETGDFEQACEAAAEISEAKQRAEALTDLAEILIGTRGGFRHIFSS
jgi:thioredoxin-like negative regulator of GroEL